LALWKLRVTRRLERPVLRDQVAAISVGHLDGGFALDLNYAEDSTARVDLNVVATGRGGIVELQGTAEGEAVPRAEIDQMVDLALEGIVTLCSIQREVLVGAGVELDRLGLTAG
jgi:ribonuclease PH